MKKRFIVLVDFSDGSENLLKYAYDWSAQNFAELLLIHQFVVAMPSLADDLVRQNLSRHAHDVTVSKLEEFAQKVLPETGRVSYFASVDHIKNILNTVLQDEFENIIFVGSREVGFLKKIFAENMAIQVIENTKEIVVAMPKEIASFTHEKIFVAVTEKHPLNILELNNFLRFIDETKTTITFFNLAKPDEETGEIEKHLRDLSKLFAERYNTGYAIFEGHNAFNDIKKVINNKIDEILIVQRGSRLLSDQIFRKFLINELVNESQTPLVVLPE